MWCIPPEQDAAFAAQMEQVLQVYARPYDAKRPVVCMDEQPKQLICQTRKPITTSTGERRIDHEYLREGVCHVLAAGREYKVVATNRLDGILMASPAVAGRALFVRSHTHLYRIETPGR